MKTKLLLATALTAILSTGVYASSKANCQGMKKMDRGNHSCQMKKGHHNKKGPIALLKKLNLTDEQHKQIKEIKQDLMKDSVKPNVAFTKDSFDKAKFIEIMKQKRDSKIEKKAEMMDRVYKILTPEQKEQFKVLVDLKAEKKAEMMKKRMNSQKHCKSGK